MADAIVHVYLGKKFLKTIDRPVHSIDGRKEVVYKGKRHTLQDGNRIQLEANSGETASRSARSATSTQSTKANADADAVGHTVPDRESRRRDIPTASDWTPDQRAIIGSPVDRRVIVEAAPGTGKTAVACARVGWLMEHGVNPSGILMVSFTRTAIHELRTRIVAHAGGREDVHAVKIATLDSTAWNLRQGFSDAAERAFRSYAEGIEAVADMLEDAGPDLRQQLEQIEHVIVDEAQDILGRRADLMIALIDLLPETAGVTVFCDSAQAIYGFTTDDDEEVRDNGPEATLPERLRENQAGQFEEKELSEVIRVVDPDLMSLFVETRRFVLHRDPPTIEDLITELKQKAAGSVDMALSKNDIAGRDDVLVLYRRRSEVLLAAAFAASSGMQFRLRMSGYPAVVPPWAACVFWDWTSPTMSSAEFEVRLGERVNISADTLWPALMRHAGRTARTIDLARLRQLLSRPSPPIELARAELGQSGPILGTIHASKGREAEEVHLMLGARWEGEDDAGEETRVLFVGATRARSTFKTGRASGSRARSTDSGRSYRFTRGSPTRPQVEFGRTADLDTASTVARQLHGSSDDVRTAQRFIEALGEPGDKGYLSKEKVGEPGDWAWLLRHESLEQPLGRLSEKLDKDLWEIADVVKQRSRRRTVHPTTKVPHLFLLHPRTVAVSPDDPCLALLHDPWASSGFWLAPTFFAFTPVGYY